MKTIILTENQTIEVVLQSAKVTADCDVVAAWADNGTVFAEGESHIKTDGTTAVVAVQGPDDVVAVQGPTQGVRRIIKSLNIFNADSVAVTATVRINSNGVYVIIASVTLSVRDTWTLEGTYDKTGSFKGIGASGLNGKTPYQLALDHGYVGSEIDWLESLHGIDGDDGKKIQLSVINNYLCQKYEGDISWTQLYKIPNAETQPIWIAAEYRDIEAGTADSHILLLKALYAFTITSCVMKLDDGTLEISFLKNGTEITGISAISATTTKTETVATGNNTVAIGDELAINWSSTHTGNPSAIIIQLNIEVVKETIVGDTFPLPLPFRLAH